MQKFILTIALILPLYTLMGSSVADSSFVPYEDFTRMSKKAILARYGHDEQAKTLIKNYYRSRRRGFVWIVPAIAFNGGGIYFAHIGARSTNGMGGVVGLVLAICLILPGLISLFLFLGNFVFRKRPSKRALYDLLQNHSAGRNGPLNQ